MCNLVVRFVFSSILKIWYVEVRISRSVSEGPFNFGIPRVDCICLIDIHFSVIDRVCFKRWNFQLVGSNVFFVFILVAAIPWYLRLSFIFLNIFNFGRRFTNQTILSSDVGVGSNSNYSSLRPCERAGISVHHKSCVHVSTKTRLPIVFDTLHVLSWYEDLIFDLIIFQSITAVVDLE